MADEVIGSPSINLKVRYEELFRGLDAAQRKVASEFEKSNSKLAKAQESTMRQMQAHIDRLSGKRATNEINLLAQAVEAMGGRTKLSSAGVKQLTADVERLAAAGAKVPKALEGLSGGGSKLGGAFAALTSGGGISGALAAIGPAGLAAATGIGAVSLAATKAVGAMSDLAAEAEQWSNAAKRTGLSTTVIQQLGTMLKDAGIPAEALTVGMKALHKEIADGGKDLAKYGIDLASIADLAPEEQMQAVAQAIMNISDENERGAAAQAAFGKSGEQLIPVLDEIAAGGYKVLDALGPKQVAALKHLDDELDKAGRSWTALKNSGLGAIASIINALDNFEDRTTGRIRTPVTESQANFERRMAQIRPAAGGISLGEETPEQKARVEAYRERQIKAEKESNKLAQDTLAVRKRYNELQASIVSRTMDEKDALGFVEDQAAAILENDKKIQAENLAALKMTRLRQGDMLFGKESGLWTKDPEVIADALELAAQKTKKVAEATSEWANALQGVALIAGSVGGKFGQSLQAIGNIGESFKGFSGMSGGWGGGKYNTILSGAGQVGGLVGGTGGKMLAGAAGGAMTGAAIGSAVPVIGTVVGGIVGGIAGAVGGYFAGRKAKKEAEEVAAMIGANFSVAQLAALKETAKKAGKDWRVFLQEEMQKAQELEQKVAARQNLEAGLGTARGGAEGLLGRLGSEDFSESLKATFGSIIGKVSDALMAAGLGVLDARLQGSAAFTGAQGAAGDVATVLAGMRQAGVLDAGLIGMGGAAAGGLQAQAVAAAKAAGLSDAEAQKAGFAAVAPLLREQLNASLASGNKLSADMQALLDQAKANGIEIVADPMIESVAVQKEQLGVLKNIAGGVRGGWSGEASMYPAAGGLRPITARGAGVINYHPNELVSRNGMAFRSQTEGFLPYKGGDDLFVLPSNMMQSGRFIRAARGYYDDAYDPRSERTGTSTAGGGGGADAGTEAGATGPVSPAVAAQIQDAVTQVMSTMTPITVKNAPVIQIVDQSVIKTIEGQRAFEQYTIGAVEKALRQNGRSLAAQIDQIAERAARRVVGA